MPSINRLISFLEIDNGGTSITILPNVLKYTLCFFPSSNINLFIDFLVFHVFFAYWYEEEIMKKIEFLVIILNA